MKKRLNKVFLTLISLFSICSCTLKKTFGFNVFAFDTVIDFKIFEGEIDDISNLNEYVNKLNKLCDGYADYGDLNNLYTLNNSNEPIVVDDDLFNLLYSLSEYQVITNGYFNPYIGSLSDAWKDSLKENCVLDSLKIDTYLDEMNNTTLVFDKENKTVFRNGNAKIDLGAIAKGYLLELSKNYLSKKNINQYLLNAGASSLLFGVNKKKETFNVGINYLDNAYLELCNTSVGTSAIYEQLTTINNVNYSHIVNPKTGSTIPNYDFIMVINENPTLCDVLSTSFMNMSIDEIKAFVDGFDNEIKVIVSNNHNIIYKSESLEVKYH